MYKKKSKKKSAKKVSPKRTTKKKTTKKSTSKKSSKSKKPVVSTLEYEIDVRQILLHSRNIFLTGVIDGKLAYKINQELLALAQIDLKPIAMWINSPGGSILDGFSIIDTMQGLSVPVVTFINGLAGSMAGIIAISGYRRVMTENSFFMAHEMTCGGYDYFEKQDARHHFATQLNKKLGAWLEEYTNLTRAQVNKAFRAEGWFNAKECLEYGIVDMIAGPAEREYYDSAK